MTKRRNFSCPYCGKVQPFFKLNAINVNQSILCINCRKEIVPKNKYLPFNFLSGVIVGYGLASMVLFKLDVAIYFKVVIIVLIYFSWMLYGYFSIVFYKQAGFDETLNH